MKIRLVRAEIVPYGRTERQTMSKLNGRLSQFFMPLKNSRNDVTKTSFFRSCFFFDVFNLEVFVRLREVVLRHWFSVSAPLSGLETSMEESMTKRSVP